MNTRSSHDRYGSVAVGIHWVSAMLVLAQVTLGLLMTRLDGGDNDLMYRVHVGIGVVVALLTIGRSVWRFVEPSPQTPPMPGWRRIIFLANHAGFYVVLLALAGTGLAVLIASGMTPMPSSVEAAAVEDGLVRDAHFILALVFSALFIMHVAGVVSYQRTKGDVFSRIGISGIASPDSVAATKGSGS